MKKFLSFLLTMLMICSSCVSGGASTELTEQQRINNETQAIIQYQQLINYLHQPSSTRISNVLADHYCGSYINNDGNLVVCVSEDYPSNEELIHTVTANDDIIIRRMKYTLTELKQEQERITALYKAYSADLQGTNQQENNPAADIVSSLCGTYIDEERNALIIEIQDIDIEKIQSFRSFFSDKDYIAFETGYFHVETATQLSHPGSALYITSNNYASMGYPVYYYAPWGQRVLGFITAGHAFEVGDLVYRNNSLSQTIGVCEKSQLSGNVDAALIRIINSSYDPSFLTQGGSPLSGSTTLAQGASVRKEGATSWTTYGKILSTNQVSTYNGSTISDLYKTSALILPGDSGGVVFSINNEVVGSVASARFSYYPHNENSFQYGTICKYENVANAFQCSVDG